MGYVEVATSFRLKFRIIMYVLHETAIKLVQDYVRILPRTAVLIVAYCNVMIRC